MQITHHKKADTIILTLAGRMDFHARQSFHPAMQKARRAQPKHIILNLSHLSYIDSAGIGQLILARKRVDTDNIRLSLETSEGYVLNVLTLTNIGKTIPISVMVTQSTSPIAGIT